MLKHRVAALVLLLVSMSAPAVHAGEIRAIWIWEQATFRMLDEPSWRDSILARLSEDGFDTLYVYADQWNDRAPITDEPDLYARLISKAHESGFRVEALLGSAYLETNRFVLPEKRDDSIRMLRRVLDYNASRHAESKFDAIHLDIEPYTLKEWKADRKVVADQFAEAATAWVELAHKNDPGIEVGAAIPFWFDGVERTGGSLADALIGTFDYVALMDYRDKAEGGDGIIEHARREVEAAARLGGKVVIGVETGEGDLDKLTFAEEGRDAMEKELGKVLATYRGAEGFDGVAIHHLDSYLRLK